MMIHTRLLAITLAALAFAGCDDALTGTVTPTPSSLNGLWTRAGEVPGSSEQWNLSMTDTVISGTGTWTGEACCNGKLTAVGYVSRDSIHLDVKFFDDTASTAGTPRFTEHVDAVQSTTDDLLGIVRRDSVSASLHMVRGDGTKVFGLD